jgi:hypothetical protein
MAPIAGFFALLDTAIGSTSLMWLDLGRTNELLTAITFVLGVPMYLIDLRLKKPVAIGLLTLITCRWAVLNAGTWPPRFSDLFAWPMGILLTLSFVFLQLSRLRRVEKSAQDSR